MCIRLTLNEMWKPSTFEVGTDVLLFHRYELHYQQSERYETVMNDLK